MASRQKRGGACRFPLRGPFSAWRSFFFRLSSQLLFFFSSGGGLGGRGTFGTRETLAFRDRKVFCEELAAFPLQFHPGDRWEYSMGLDVIGRVLEARRDVRREMRSTSTGL